ncbi:flagellar export protein FliJ [Thermoclostridium stercorarium subsp. stercorarium DSM 8532]|jgi:flagellar FliJ protein|uniref:Flagellar FliJ protein n=3 Tax=Thermoclostridium stercorarium TaxID=1510 RepID=L7VPS9_THES1|nr:flagellar export protein FliJ [Thermoclostridium stercorarium]AGC67588.1 flagellar export protein FliJ [Thermoclostridium stercorarium subsp. stercorarium DSM 8532]AGI38638.1 FliJ [Thermoclostridium stercorarium subsp. stercorarium DSM 8532]ANW98010.1 flagellar export protein FliJ [Thermoclostridium stercorarium subsp. thermolacticum DSM 2910]ANX00558.1 flagellar export protein FliJ [Thermoclostridium stercorarium subsp. leptospartum DSM 9219]
MARFSFRLQPFLNLKEMMEKNIKNELGIAVQKYQQQLLVLSEIREEIDIQQQEFRKEGISLTTPLKLRQRMEYIKVVQNREKVQIERVNEEKRNVDKIRKRLMETMKEKKILEKLKERQLDEFKKEQEKKQQLLVDEIVSFKETVTPQNEA